MRLQPLKRYAAPQFPTWSILDEHPELLRLVPKRWQANQVVMTALAGMCMLVAGTRAHARIANPSYPRIAPVFEHGEGRVQYGGAPAAISQPTLTEDEARLVITDEAKKAGITLTPDARTLPSIEVPVTDSAKVGFTDFGRGNPLDQAKHRPLPLKLDGTDSTRNISYEYVSMEDFSAWEKRGEFSSTLSSYDLIGAAQVLRAGLSKAKPKGSYVVFYDPIASASMADIEEKDESTSSPWEKLNALAKERSKEQLRAQVRDFIKWLKGQGVI